MAPPSSRANGRHRPESVVEQSRRRRTETADAAQINPARPTGRGTSVHHTDLIDAGMADDDVPPPAYGDSYGEIHNEKQGLGTRAHVTNDGRVDIQINQLNRRLSQIFSPALREFVQNAQDGPQPPSPYIPPNLGGEGAAPPPPPLNVVIHVVGSRGDVQPFVALGKVLKNTYGHRVRLATHPNFGNFVQENGLEFFSIGGDPSQLMAFMVKNPAMLPGFRGIISGDIRQQRRAVAEYIQGCWRSCYQAGDGLGSRATDNDLSESEARPFVADCIIANPPSFAHIHCAEKLGVPLHIMFTMPYSPTQAFPHPLANIKSSNADTQLTNYMSYAMIELLTWQGLGEIINRFRTKCLDLDPVSLIWAPGMLHRLKIPHTYCWSPALIPKPKDWGPHISTSGFYFLDLASNYTPALNLEAFLEAGPPPVYIGFGSIVLDDSNAMTELVFKAAKKSGQRVLLSKGWGGLGADELRVPDAIFMLGNVPHDWLFKRVSCVVHHGGAGTTAAGITAGRPTVIVPFFGDQPFWGAMVAGAGAGPVPIPHKELTADKLADAIKFCLEPEILGRAKELANNIAAERGSDKGAQSFHQYLDVDNLRCTLAPSRVATWRIKRTQVKLSAFAACTLVNANLLDFHDLKLFRSREYETDEGPWDPISGGFMAACGSFSDMAMGIATIPSETAKALGLPFRSSRQQSQVSGSNQSQASGSKLTERRETKHVGNMSPPRTSPDQSQTSLNGQKSHASVWSPSQRSRLSSRTSSISSFAKSDASQGQSSPHQDNASQRRVRSREETGSHKDHDMLRNKIHSNKGVGQFAKALVQSPMDLSISWGQGFHNLPKLWGDETVRPQAQITGFKSGARAIGKEFGLGWYDAVTGLVVQPWKGARKQGATGFVKGIGRGMGGFITKPSAALFGTPGYFLKGVQKEVQRIFGSNVQNYIISSRAAQGYDEWLQSADAEKELVIARWKLIQKPLKRKVNPDEMVQDILDGQRTSNMMDEEANQNYGRTVSSPQSARAGGSNFESETAMLVTSDSPPPSLGAAHISNGVQPSLQETSHGESEEEYANTERRIQENISVIHHQRQENANHRVDDDTLHRALAASEAEAHRQASEALEYQKRLKGVMEWSLREQAQISSGSEYESDLGVDDEDEEEERARRKLGNTEESAAVTGESSGMQQTPSYDPGHLAGTTRAEFEFQQWRQQPGAKTTQERAEEDVVVEYVKKQSLLEVHHRSKGKGRTWQ